MIPNAQPHFCHWSSKMKEVPPCLSDAGAVLFPSLPNSLWCSVGLCTCKAVVAGRCVWSGLQSVMKAPSLPSSSWSLSALVKSHRASCGMQNKLKTCKTEDTRVWLSGTRRSCGVTWGGVCRHVRSTGWVHLFEEACFQLNQYRGSQQRVIKANNWE